MPSADLSGAPASPLLELEPKTESSGRTGKGVSIVLIDRRPLTRQCLGRWLQEGSPGLQLSTVGSPADLLDSSRPAKEPQMIVFSIGGASVRDSEILGRITLLRRHMSRIPLVLLADNDDVDEIVAAIELGVRGYIPTSLESSEATAAIQCVVAGGTFVPVSALIRFVQERQNGGGRVQQGEANPPLTPREREVLTLLRQGKPNKIIAHELDIRESTVKVFVRRILMKLHASNRTEVACLVRDRANEGYLKDVC